MPRNTDPVVIVTGKGGSKEPKDFATGLAAHLDPTSYIRKVGDTMSGKLDIDVTPTGNPTTQTNNNALEATGHGTGSGVVGTGGITDGNGVEGYAGGGTGIGVLGNGADTGAGVSGIGGAIDGNGVIGAAFGTGAGVVGTGGGTSGIGVDGIGGPPDGIGVRGQGDGTGRGGEFFGGGTGADGVLGSGAVKGAGVYGNGGSTAPTAATESVGVLAEGGSAGGHGLYAGAVAGNSSGAVGQGFGSGTGVDGTGGSTAGAIGVVGSGGSSGGAGISGTGRGTYPGVIGLGGNTADNTTGYAVQGTAGAASKAAGGFFSGGGAVPTAATHSVGVIAFGGAAGGTGLIATAQANNDAGIAATGHGTGTGVEGDGGGSDGTGVYGTGGATNGIGVQGLGTGTGTGVFGSGGATDGIGVDGQGLGAGQGVRGTGGATDGVGVTGQGVADGVGVTSIGGNSAAASDSDAVGAGLHSQGGSGGAVGANVEGTGARTGLYALGGPTNGVGATAQGQGSGFGAYGIGGPTDGVGGGFIGGGNGQGLKAWGSGTADSAIRAYGTDDNIGVWGTATDDGIGVQGGDGALEAATSGGLAIDVVSDKANFTMTGGSAVDDYYNGWLCLFNDGAAINEVRTIIDYTGATKSVTLSSETTGLMANGDFCTLYHAGHGLKGRGSYADTANSASHVNFDSSTGVVGWGQDGGHGGHFVGGILNGDTANPGCRMGFGVVGEGAFGGVFGKGGTGGTNNPGLYGIGVPGAVFEGAGAASAMRLVPSGQPSTAPAKGDMYVANSGTYDGVPHFYDGSTWRSILGPFQRELVMDAAQGAAVDGGTGTRAIDPEIRWDTTDAIRMTYAQITATGDDQPFNYYYGFTLPPGFVDWDATSGVQLRIKGSDVACDWSIVVYKNSTAVAIYSPAWVALGSTDVQYLDVTKTELETGATTWIAGDKISILAQVRSQSAGEGGGTGDVLRHYGCRLLYTERNTY